MNRSQNPLVVTIKERCRTCYTCVRECPAKAIRIADGQAEVVASRCIGCGNCVRVCSQGAKQVRSSVEQVEELLRGERPVAACIAPSFPAEFVEMDHGVMVGMLRNLGFAIVHEVGFGADLVAKRTREMLLEEPDARCISTSCPAIVGYVERYQPQLIDSLQKIVSPMTASAMALRKLHGDDLAVVFIGPCISKKGEAEETEGPGRVDEAMTFVELRELFRRQGIAPEGGRMSEFDPPHANLGGVFPLARGLLRAAAIEEDLVASDIVAADGRADFPAALEEFHSGDLDARFLDILCCNGCIVGAGMSCKAPLFRSRARVSRYVNNRRETLDVAAWEKAVGEMADLDLSREFVDQDQRLREPDEGEINDILGRMGKHEAADQLNCRACGYATCHDHAVAIFKGMAESEMCLPYVIETMRSNVDELNLSHQRLASAQEQLMHSERLASMGQLAAGIAHEVNNPLGVVLLYSNLLLDDNDKDSPIGEDLQMIAEQAGRCKTIVSGLLNFARQNKVALMPVRLADFLQQSLKGCIFPPEIAIDIEHQDPELTAEIDSDQLSQVITNLVSNALAAMTGEGKITIRSSAGEQDAVISVSDTGTGIAPEHIKNIFEPFFTTKQMGKGTGLGLAVSYGIIKMHRGTISVESNADPSAGPTGTTFTIHLPLRGVQDSAPVGESEILNIGENNEQH